MTDWTVRDTFGVLVVLSASLSGAVAVAGVARALLALLGVVVASLWIANVRFRRSVDPLRSTDSTVERRSTDSNR